jgi:hypothetical protein
MDYIKKWPVHENVGIAVGFMVALTISLGQVEQVSVGVVYQHRCCG